MASSGPSCNYIFQSLNPFADSGAELNSNVSEFKNPEAGSRSDLDVSELELDAVFSVFLCLFEQSNHMNGIILYSSLKK